MGHGDRPGLTGDEPPKIIQTGRHRTASQRRAAASTDPDPLDAVGTFPVHGRVLDPDGKPIVGAELWVRHEISWDRPLSERVALGRPAESRPASADGSFRFDLDKAASDSTSGDDPAWHSAQVAAVVPRPGSGLDRC